MTIRHRIHRLFVFFILIGLAGFAQAAISQQSAWASQYAGATYPSGTVNAGYTVAAGSQRLLVVAISSTRTAVGTQTVSVTYGGQALTLAAGDGTSAVTWNHSYLYYLKDAGIAAASGTALNVTITGGTSYYTWVYAAVYAGVDQSVVYTDTRNYNSATADSAVGPFSPALTINVNDQAVEIVNLARSSSGTSARGMSTWATGWTTAEVAPTAIATSGPCAAMFIRDRNVLTAASDGSQHTANSTSTWDSMTAMSLHVPTFSTTVGNGTDPGAASLCPGGAATVLDAFTLGTSGNTDTVTAVTVSLSSGSAAGLSKIEITDDAGATVYGSVTSPSSDTTILPLGTSITATTTTAQYKIRITPKSAAAMPAPPGTTYAMTGTVTAITDLNLQVYSDSTSAAVTVDNTSPANAAWGAITPGSSQMTLNWTNPADSDFSQVVILRKMSAITDTPAEGVTYAVGNTIGTSTVVYAGNAQTAADTGTTDGYFYYYKIFARDACVNYSSNGVQSGPYQSAEPRVIVQPPASSVDSCHQITITAPFLGDTDTNSATTISQGPSASGPWTVICSALTGPNPGVPGEQRVCVDSTVVAGSTYYYQVQFADADGVVGSATQIIGPLATPSCGLNPTTTAAASVQVSSCNQLTVSANFTGDDNHNGSTLVEYGTSSSGPWTSACGAMAGSPPRTCMVGGLTASSSYYVRVTFSDGDGVTGTNPLISGPYATPACGSDAMAPTVQILSPFMDDTIGGTERVKVQVYDAGGLAASNPVQWSVDGGSWTAANTVNSNYNCNDPVSSTACRIYEFDLNTTAMASARHTLKVRAADAAGNVGVDTTSFIVYNIGGKATGDGNLLRRTQSSQLCKDCHALETHSSQYSSTRYGNWSIDCYTCHSAHGTTNIYLVRNSILTPNSSTKSVVFQVDDKSGRTDPQYSFLGDTSGANNAPYNDGICEVCHTKTAHFRNDTVSGGDHTHNAGVRCLDCHTHDKGFKAHESLGCAVLTEIRTNCSLCHDTQWNGMTGAVAKTTKHTLGAVVGTNDTCADSGLAWSNPLSGNAASSRSCINMCHPDHQHNAVGGTTHANNVHKDAGTPVSRGVNRDSTGAVTAAATSGSPDNTDFDPSAANGGLCISCHQFSVNSPHPAINKTAFDQSAHDYTTFGSYGAWTYTMHDGSLFNRDCTKCHSDRNDGRPAAVNYPGYGAVHYSDYPSLLAGSTNPAGAPSVYLCYNCHGNGATGVNLSGKDLATDMAKTGGRHPVNSDTVHNTITEDAAPGATYGNGVFSGSNRHVNCLDCHDAHFVKAGIHTYGTTATSARNQISNVLAGVNGVQFNWSGMSNWGAPAAANFTWIPIATGVTYEYQICFKCHTSYTFGGTPPNGLSPNGTAATPVETDLAMEFNPNNMSGHPVVTGLDNYPNSTAVGSPAKKGLQTGDLKAPWNVNNGSQTMMCSDCHNTDAATPAAQGPHGSASQFMLRPFTGYPSPANWPHIQNSSANWGSSTNGAWCMACHNEGSNAGHTNSNHSSYYCDNCHIVIPHGGKVSRLLLCDLNSAVPLRYYYNNTRVTNRLNRTTKAAAGSYTQSTCNGCSEHSASAGEVW